MYIYYIYICIFIYLIYPCTHTHKYRMASRVANTRRALEKHRSKCLVLWIHRVHHEPLPEKVIGPVFIRHFASIARPASRLCSKQGLLQNAWGKRVRDSKQVFAFSSFAGCRCRMQGHELFRYVRICMRMCRARVSIRKA